MFNIIKNIFTCKFQKKAVSEYIIKMKIQIKDDSKSDEKIGNLNITLITLQNLLKESKNTELGSTRFILPFNWLEQILNNSQEKMELNNSIFLDPKKNKLRKDIDKSNISLVIFEIMKYINDSFNVDYIIKIKYDNIRKKINLDEVEVIKPEEFNKIGIFTNEIKKTGIESGYLKPSEFSMSYFDLSESKNQLLKEPLQNSEEKDMSTTIRKINTESGNFSDNSNIINKLGENDINHINKDEEKSGDKKKNKEGRDDNSEELEVEELNENEKIHQINNRYYRNLSLEEVDKFHKEKNEKEKKENKIIDNRNEKNNKINQNEIKDKSNKEDDTNDNLNEEKKEEMKKYVFNESQLTINLSDYTGETISPIGLVNPSIYCFMICILQTLLSIPELNYYFLCEFFLGNNKDEKNENDMTTCIAFHNFIKSYKMGKRYISIHKQLFRICNNLLGGMRMHDSQEFLVCFLDAIQKELNSNEKCNIPENASMEERWVMYRKVNNSFIDSIFTGLMRSTVQCKKCKYKSYTYEPFMDLSVSINKYKNLEKCLKQYFENEKIACEYKCEHCKNVAKVCFILFIILIFILQAIKKLDIMIPPPILTIHFKRFEDDGRKINNSIKYKATIDIKK